MNYVDKEIDIPDSSMIGRIISKLSFDHKHYYL